MDRQVLLLLCLLLLQTEVSAGEKYLHILKTCQLVERGSKYDMQYRIQYHYSGRLQAEYNSSTEKVVGFTDYGKQFADAVNKDPEYLWINRYNLKYSCKNLAGEFYADIRDKAVPPVASLKSAGSGTSRDSVVLVCSAYDFYPRQIRLSWLRDGVIIPDPPGVIVTEMPGGSWRFQIHSHLEHSVNSVQDISCMVEHAGLRRPQLLKLDQLEREAVGLPLGGSILGLGMAVLLVATVCWRRTQSRRS